MEVSVPKGVSAGLRARRRRRSKPIREGRWFYLIIAPWLLGFVLFFAGPLVASLYFSLTDYDLLTSPDWSGLENYDRLVHDPLFWKSLKVTAIFTALNVPVVLIASLGLALLLNEKVPGQGIFRTAFYLPSVIAAVPLAVLWLWILAPDFGVLNYVLNQVGLDAPDWLNSETWVLPAIVLVSLWGLGSTMVIFLASLQSIPRELYEAASLDGAGAIQRFRAVTFPTISPVVFFNLIITIIASFQVFTIVQVMTTTESGSAGGPNYASYVLVMYLYDVAFRDFRMGYASALAWALFLVIVIVTFLAFRSARYWVHYEGDLS